MKKHEFNFIFSFDDLFDPAVFVIFYLNAFYCGYLSYDSVLVSLFPDWFTLSSLPYFFGLLLLLSLLILFLLDFFISVLYFLYKRHRYGNEK